MGKAKNKAKHKKPSLTTGFLIAFAWIPICIVAIVIILIPFLFLSSQITQTSLPDNLQLIAEQQPSVLPRSEYIEFTDNVSLRLDIWRGAVSHTGILGDSICVSGLIPEETKYQAHSRLYVNGEIVRGNANWRTAIYIPYTEGYKHMFRCAEGNLESGLHLIEFQLRDSFWGEPIATQQWAIEIE